MKNIWVAIVRLFGWKFDIPTEGTRPEVYHCVLIMAPHTSIYDFFLGAACLWKMKVNAKIFMKKELFTWYLTPLLNYFGVVPVDRGNKNNNLVDFATSFLEKDRHATIVITPEGTRKAVKRWKRGFYEIALETQLPIVVTYIDYKTRIMGLGPSIMPTGDFNADMLKIMQFYIDKGVTARHPEMFCVDTSAYETK